MGVYYTAYCEERNEYIDPAELKDHGIKLGSVCHGRLGHLLVFMLTHNRWPSACMVGDIEVDDARNVTVDAVDAFNAECSAESRIELGRRAARGWGACG